MEAEGRSGWGWLTQGRLALLIIFLVLVIDQWIKIAVKTHMYLHESIRVDRLVLHSLYGESRHGIRVGNFLDNAFSVLPFVS